MSEKRQPVKCIPMDDDEVRGAVQNSFDLIEFQKLFLMFHQSEWQYLLRAPGVRQKRGAMNFYHKYL